MVIELWSRNLGVSLTGRRFQSRNALTVLHGKHILLLCPDTFMNLGGKSVRACADHYRLDTEEILVIHDDLDLPVGRIKVTRSGSAGGHKGVLSVVKHLGSIQFPRIKIGIGRPRHEESTSDYVLSPFYVDEKQIMKNVIRMAVEACELFILEGLEPAMNLINCQNLTN